MGVCTSVVLDGEQGWPHGNLEPRIHHLHFLCGRVAFAQCGKKKRLSLLHDRCVLHPEKRVRKANKFCEILTP